MDSRRDFLKKAALLSGSAVAAGMLPPVIQKAMAINPTVGSTFYDAEHIVFLMQENRSFDHQLGMLQGVRGFNDPRAINLPNKNKVWLQTDKKGDTYGPMRLNVKDTKAAWMGSLPHTWPNQQDAMNGGKYNRWLEVKQTGNKAYAGMPLTLGYCEREDQPFYYSLADAFTVCDQNFCSSITGTHSNRHYFMSGTVRESNNVIAIAHLWNVTNLEYPELEWKTFPEYLEDHNVSWKVYQNELTMGYGFKGEEGSWLGNFGCNDLEFFKAYNVRLHEGGITNLQTKKENLFKEIESLEKQPDDAKAKTRLAAARRLLPLIEKGIGTYTTDSFNSLPQRAKNLNTKAFTTNIKDPDYHTLTSMSYEKDGVKREMQVPKGDVFHQFRQDVKNGTLPTVSWLTPSANFSDHPSLPWFGPWFVSEAMEILTENPEVWKKTIFIVTYDENDGYFDHVPPYTVPNPYKEGSGKVSKGIDPKMDWATKDQQTNPSANPANIREASIGLGFRVPMIIASPWSRGGFVCSELFDHTSSLQFLEHFLNKKYGKKIHNDNITQWRRTICGDLTSAFRPYNGEKIEKPAFLPKNAFYEAIHNAQFKDAPNKVQGLTADQIALINMDHHNSPLFPQQEKGVRNSCALPYELYSNIVFSKAKNSVALSFEAGNKIFGANASGSPFRVYAMKPYQQDDLRSWDHSVAAGDILKDELQLSDFENGNYHLRVYAPNGFYREFIGDKSNPLLQINCEHEMGRINKNKPTGYLVIHIANTDTKAHTVLIADASYKAGTQTKAVPAGKSISVIVELKKSHSWYDVIVTAKGYPLFKEQFAGRVETGAVTKTDPLMGGVA